MDLTATPRNGNIELKFQFELLSLDEIVSCLDEMEIEITKDDIKEASRHKDKIKTVWYALIEETVGKNETAVKENEDVLKEQAKEKTQFPVLHQDFGDIFLFRTLRSLLKKAGYDYFSLSDLHAPTKKRLRDQFSALINLVKFQHEGEQQQTVALLKDNRKTILDEIETHEQASVAVEQRLVSMKTSVENANKELEEIKKECDELEDLIAHHNKLQTTARKNGAVLKTRAADLKDELERANWQLKQAEKEEELLQEQVVSSPDRRKAEVSTAREDLDQIKTNLSEINESVIRRKKSRKQVEQVLHDVKKVIQDLEELQKSCTQNSEVNIKLASVRQEVAAKRNKQKALTKEKEDVERENARLENKMKTQGDHHENEMAKLREARDVAKSQLLETEKKSRNGMIRVKEAEREVQRLEGQIERLLASNEEETLRKISEYKAVEEEYLDRVQKWQEETLR